jgi:hypothetical protein
MHRGAEWLTERFGVPVLVLAGRAFRDVNDAAKTVDTARAIASYLLQVVGQKAAPHPHLTHHGFRITFGAVVLALRRFEDDWARYVCHLFAKAERPAEAASLLEEIRARRLRDAANLLIAHSGEDVPLSTTERIQKIINTGWATEEELVAWYPSVALRLLHVRDAIGQAWPGAERGVLGPTDPQFLG